MKPSQLIESNGLFWSLIRSWAFASHGQPSFDAAKDIKDFLDKTIKLDNKQQKITNVTNYSYAMPIPEGYAFSQVGDVVSVAPFVAVEKACEEGEEVGKYMPEGLTNSDGYAIDKFADAMKMKMARASLAGRSGWSLPYNQAAGSGCTDDQIANLLIESVKKGDPVDIANYAMMMYNRESLFGYSATGIIRDHASLGEAYEAQQKTNGETVLKVQAALGLPVDAWVSADVVMLRLNQLKVAAEINTAPGTPARVVIETSHMMNVETAHQVESIANIEKAIINELKPTARKPYFPSVLCTSEEDARMWAKIHEAIAIGVKASGHLAYAKSDELNDFVGLIIQNAKMHLAQFIINNSALSGQVNVELDNVTHEAWQAMDKAFVKGFDNFFSGYVAKSVGKDIHAETMAWPGAFYVSRNIVNAIKELANTGNDESVIHIQH